MKNTRIRYNNLENTLVSKETFLSTSGNGLLTVTISKVTSKWTVSNQETILSEGVASNVRAAKSIVKKELKKLGASFGDEVRQKRKAEVVDEAS